MWEARKYCWKILALAREIEKEDKTCCQILRATSNTLATCHVPRHAEGSAMYALSALQNFYKDKMNKDELEKFLIKERKRQIIHLKDMIQSN